MEPISDELWASLDQHRMKDYMWTHRIVNSPWPERNGLKCRIVRSAEDVYPWAGLPDNERVVLVNDDPFPVHHEDWSCVLDKANLERL